MRIVFAGSSPLGCPTLSRLLDSERHTVAGVITQPDRPRGRRLRVAPCAIRVHLGARELPILQPENVNRPESVEAVRALAPDILVVVAYGQILKRPLLELPPRGCVNMHASLLPAYRGAAPIQWAIADGCRETGVTVMQMNERMDAGAILAQRTVAIAGDDTAATLHDRLAEVGGTLMPETLAAIERGTVRPRPQDDEQATYAPKLRKEDGRIDWTMPAEQLYNRIRGFNPWPCCHCRIPAARSGARRLRVLRAAVGAGVGKPGELLDTGADGPLVAAGEGALRLLEVQPEGRRVMSGADFLRGHELEPGIRLE